MIQAGANAEGLRRDATLERWQLFGLSLPAVLLVVVTMVLPVAWLFYLSFLADDGSYSLVHYQRLVEQPSYARTFRATFEISAIAT
ncbi:MAG: ABC transporter permease, partial [Rhodospirillales bacterium]|nr:ABC transporter permease [Rhodospirillales bacterium]